MQDQAPRPTYEPGDRVPATGAYEVIDRTDTVVAVRRFKVGAKFPRAKEAGQRYRPSPGTSIGPRPSSASGVYIVEATRTYATTLERLAKK